MIDEHSHLRLRSADHLDPIWRLWEGLPAQWRGPVLGPGIQNWASITENDWPHLDLSGLPVPFAAELAWMAHWQASDGTRVSVLAMAQLANMIRRAVAEGRDFPHRSGRWITTPPRRCRAGSISARAGDCPQSEAGAECTLYSVLPDTR